MKVIVIDSDTTFTIAFSRRCKEAGSTCLVYDKIEAGLAELRLDPGSVDIVLIGRENSSGPEAGLEAAAAIRRDPTTAEVPFIITSSAWTKPDFARHQKTEFGANAYFGKKTPLSELEATIEAVTGLPFAPGTKKTKSVSFRPDGVILQDAADVVTVNEPLPQDHGMKLPDDLIPLPPQATPGVEGEVSKKTDTTLHFSVPRPPEQAPPTQAAANQGPTTQATSTGIEIRLETTEEPSRDNAGAPQTQVPAAPAAAAPVPAAPAPEGAAIDLPALEVSKSLSIESAKATSKPAAPAAPAASGDGPVSEEEAARDLPYLFGGGQTHAVAPTQLGTKIGALGGAGSAAAEGLDDLKKYITLREQEIAVLGAQLTYAKEELSKSEESIKRLSLQNDDLIHQLNDLKIKISHQSQELRHAGRTRDGELEQLRQELKAKIDRIGFLEERLKDSADEYEKLKERVRLDIRKIRVREKELESKLEILKKDSETLIGARENKILELKRKIDLLEFNYDTLQDKNESERQNTRVANEKIERVLKIIKLAIGVVEGDEASSQAPGAGRGGEGNTAA